MARNILTLPPPPPGIVYPYGLHPLQFGHLRVPAGSGPYGVAIVVHGGFWQAEYDLQHIGHLAAALTAAGMATWTIEYRRVGNGGGWPHTFLDVAAAADAVRDLAPRYNLDLGRVAAAGHSAGGHLALWLAGRPRIPPEDPLAVGTPLPLTGVVSLAGVTDLVRGARQRVGRGAVQSLMGGEPDERYPAASPQALLPLGVPQVLVHGTEDDRVPYAFSEEYTRAAHDLGDPVRLVRLVGTGHFELIDPESDAWPPVRDAVVSAVG